MWGHSFRYVWKIEGLSARRKNPFPNPAVPRASLPMRTTTTCGEFIRQKFLFMLDNIIMHVRLCNRACYLVSQLIPSHWYVMNDHTPHVSRFVTSLDRHVCYNRHVSEIPIGTSRTTYLLICALYRYPSSRIAYASVGNNTRIPREQ
jgi:hypothetical protein